MPKPSSTLGQGVERMSRIVRAARERQRSKSGFDDAPLTAMNPSEAWARKYLSESIGPVMPRSIGHVPQDMPSASRQAQFMRELKAKAGETKKSPQMVTASGKMAMERPFAPTSARHSGWAKLLRGK